ncbi:MAG: hypothetical protein ACRC0L_11130, partial [Angustibacter sp.]
MSGILTSESAGAWWAWCGVRVTAAVDLTQVSRFRRTDRETALGMLLAADRAYLAVLLGGTTQVELRWTKTKRSDQMQLTILGLVCASTRIAAEAQARDARRVLASVPAHVVAAEIRDAAELADVLCPPWLAGESAIAGEFVELRKR